MLVAFDPSTSAIGYCACEPEPWWLAGAGRIRADRVRDDAVVRIRGMASDVLDVLDEYHPDLIVVEIPADSVHALLLKRNRGRGAATYGMGVGYVLSTVDAWASQHCSLGREAVHTIDPTTWTGGVPKWKRKQRLIAEFPKLRNELVTDTGGDMADAIELSRWFSARIKLGRAVAV